MNATFEQTLTVYGGFQKQFMTAITLVNNYTVTPSGVTITRVRPNYVLDLRSEILNKAGTSGRELKDTQMKRKHLAIIAILAVGLALPSDFVWNANALNESDLLRLQIKKTAIHGESIDQILDRLPSEYEIPIGIELGDEKLTPRYEINLDLPETTLKDFLAAVTAKDPRYAWKLEEGVIHVWPVSGRDTLLATLLEVKVSHFAISDNASRYQVYNDVMNLPEIKNKLIVAGVEPMIFLSSGSMTKLGEGILFNDASLTLRQLLDKILLKTDMNKWVISRWGKNSEYITLKP